MNCCRPSDELLNFWEQDLKLIIEFEDFLNFKQVAINQLSSIG
jgi:hypothetical protein